jgi:hypothetical protein
MGVEVHCLPTWWSMWLAAGGRGCSSVLHSSSCGQAGSSIVRLVSVELMRERRGASGVNRAGMYLQYVLKHICLPNRDLLLFRYVPKLYHVHIHIGYVSDTGYAAHPTYTCIIDYQQNTHMYFMDRP